MVVVTSAACAPARCPRTRLSAWARPSVSPARRWLLEPSYVLRALGRSDELAHSSLRMTIGRFTTIEEIDFAVSTIRHNVAKLRELSPLWEMYQDGVDISTIQWAAH